MRRLAILISLLALSQSACASSGGPEPSTGDDFTLPPPSDPMSTWQSKSPDGGSDSVSGTFGFDDIEGGCWFLGADDGTRYEVVYPDGWSLDRTNGMLRGPTGEVVGLGERLTVRGSIATDRGSICQIGPIFLATEVELGGT